MPETATPYDPAVADLPRLTPDDLVTFRCSPEIDCFTQCCRDVSIVLTPYDVLRLSRALGVRTDEFLEAHTITPFTRDQKVPVVLLKMDPETKRCPFVGETGCRVYPDRPWACRMYPLGLAEPKDAGARRFHFLVREDSCHGHHCGTARTVRQWVREQGVDDYEMMGRSFAELMLHEGWARERPLTPQQMAMYYTACYDLDAFRRFVFETRFLALFDIDEARVEALRQDDQELLDFAVQWLRFSLFGERTLRLKPEAGVPARGPHP
jgi:hypothetical protein